MSDHLTPELLSALADGELADAELLRVNQHLEGCSACTRSALAESLQKAATARVGQRYAPPPGLRERLEKAAVQEALRPPEAVPLNGDVPARRGAHAYGWLAAVAILLVAATVFLVQRGARQTEAADASLVAEVCDQHIATLADNAPPEVISTDRHTVKPWFQGKLPFSFDLPQSLPGDTTLDGANLTYLRGQPTAQLLFSIGKHHVSMFVQQRTATADASSGVDAGGTLVDHSGFHVTGFRTDALAVTAVSDVDPARLTGLVELMKQAQAQGPAQTP